MTTTTAVGSAGLYGLYHLIESGETSKWYATWGVQFVDFIGLDLTRTGWSLVLLLVYVYVLLAFGSLLPDIDSKKSILGRYVPFIQDIFGHRQLIHSIWIVLILVFISYLTKSLTLWLLTIGYFAHMIQDRFSLMGIQWFYPFGKSSRGFYRVGSVGETIFFWLMVALHIYMLYLWVQTIFL